MCLVTGKRHLICQDIGSAVESLGESVFCVIDEILFLSHFRGGV